MLRLRRKQEARTGRLRKFIKGTIDSEETPYDIKLSKATSYSSLNNAQVKQANINTIDIT